MVLSLIAVLAAISPVLLIPVSQFPNVDWPLLSNVGQTYGVTSALLSAFALSGVAASMYLQSRQLRAQIVQTARTMHAELLYVVLEDPDLYAACVDAWPAEMATDDKRRSLFLTLWFNYARMGFELGTISEKSLREEILAGTFGSQVGLDYWRRSGHYWSPDSGRRKGPSAFERVVHSEYLRAVAAAECHDD